MERREWLPVDVFGETDLKTASCGWWGRTSLWPSLSGPIHLSPQINLASNVIAALSTFETGQFFSASLAIRANAAWSRFGTWARRVRADRCGNLGLPVQA